MLIRDRMTEIETIVVGLLEDFGITEYPMSIGRVAEVLGVELIPRSLLPHDVQMLALQASEDAFTVSTPDFMRVQTVFDDRGSYFYRSRFSGAHELGHIILEHPRGGAPYEEEADYLGGYLLVPHPLALEFGRAPKVAEAFGVSVPCAEVALNQAIRRQREGTPWLPHERWILENTAWRGGGLLGHA